MSIPIGITETIFSFTAGLTYAEYLSQVDQQYRQFLIRRHRAVCVDVASQCFLTSFSTWCYLAMLVNEDTPDTPLILPLIQRMAELCPRMELRYFPESSDLSGLNDLLNDDIDLESDLADLELPQLFLFDEEWNQVGQWGPRPQLAEEKLEQWLAQHPQYELLFNDEEEEEPGQYDRLMIELTHQMRLWYNDELTAAAITEVIDLLKQIDQTETDNGS
jgi:hypothetical protein